MPSSLKRIAIITVIPEAEKSVRRVFRLLQDDHFTGRLYFSASLPTEDGSDVVVYSTQCRDRSNIPAAVTATELVIDLAPDCVMVVDIAGGVGRDADGVSLGDVLVGSFLRYYEFEKHVDGSIKERAFSMEEPSPRLLTMVSRIRSVPGQSAWSLSIVAPRPMSPDGKEVNSSPGLRTGEIICGDKLLGDPEDPMLEMRLDQYDKADGIDMESVGVARALYEMRTRHRVEFLVIRGISDLCNREGNQKTRDAWKEYAADAAAAFAFELVSRAGMLSKSPELLASYREQLEQRNLTNPRLRDPLAIRLALPGRGDVSTAEPGSLYGALAGTRRLLIHASAGSGKTFAVERLASGCLAANGIPVLISAASCSTRLQARLDGKAPSDADILLAEALVPARLSLLDGMPSGIQRVVIFDGLNEVYGTSAAYVLKALDWIVTTRLGYSVVVTDRTSRMSWGAIGRRPSCGFLSRQPSQRRSASSNAIREKR
jgi:nucleoside phosphorylase